MLDEPEDEVVLFLALHGYKVHAVLAAYVAGVQPVHARVAILWVVTAEEVVVSTVEEFFWPWSETIIITYL